MPQVGVLSLSQLQLHDHYDANVGGPILEITRTPSANIQINNGAQRVTPAGGGAFRMLKRVLILEDSPGDMDINYTLARAGGAGTVHAQARIYRAGVLIWSGADNATAAGPTVFTDNANLDLLALDQVEIWGRVSAGAATICSVELMEMLWDAKITALTRRPVSIGIALTGAGILNQVVL